MLRFDPKTLMKNYDGAPVVEPIFGADGKQKQDATGALIYSPPVALSDLLKTAFARYQPKTEQESIEAYGLNKRVFVSDGEHLEFTVEEVATLKKIAASLMASPLHYGQLLDILENQYLPAADDQASD
jgi:hypothetical protein